MIAKYRTQAIIHLQTTIPDKIKSLQSLLASEDDPSSVLWKGHVHTPSYTSPSRLQPSDSLAKALEAKLVFPKDEASSSAGRKAIRASKGDNVGGGGRVGVSVTVSTSAPPAAADAAQSDGGASDAEGGSGSGSDEEEEEESEVEETDYASDEDYVAYKDSEGTSKAPKNAAHWYEVVPGNSIQRDLISLSVQWVFSLLISSLFPSPRSLLCCPLSPLPFLPPSLPLSSAPTPATWTIHSLQRARRPPYDLAGFTHLARVGDPHY